MPPLLPEIDLANFAVMSPPRRRKALESFQLKRPPHSYDPFRKSSLDVMNVDAGPLGLGTGTPWNVIESDIRKRSRHAGEEAANLGVAKALHQFIADADIRGRRHDFLALPLGTSTRVEYWSKIVLSVEGRPLVPFIDPRRQSTRLSIEGRRFVLSAMHERIRAVDPDFSDSIMGIFQFGAVGATERLAQLHTDAGLDLLDFDTLDELVRETYAMWHEVLAERHAEARRGTGTHGPLI